jgi:REP element-mobilizing transposase RayT
VDEVLKQTCLEISKRYEIAFLEIGTDQDHVHFLVQSVPRLSPKRIVQIIKSLTAREIFRVCPEVKKQLWGGEFWSNGYFVSTVGQQGNEATIKKYIQGQDAEYKQLHKEQLKLF